MNIEPKSISKVAPARVASSFSLSARRDEEGVAVLLQRNRNTATEKNSRNPYGIWPISTGPASAPPWSAYSTPASSLLGPVEIGSYRERSYF